MPILKVRDSNGNISEIIALVGRQGDSAYEIAKQNGFTGTIEEWLESLKGNKVDETEVQRVVEDYLAANPPSGNLEITDDGNGNVVIAASRGVMTTNG